MTVIINSVHFTADAKLKQFIEEKINKLTKFYDRIIDVEVFLKLENSGQVKDKIVELKTNIPGATLIASSTEKTFESSVDSASLNMIRQLKRRKEKQRSQ
jgi:putative sigma-54 modulation protein